MRIALVEDHAMFREVLRKICATDCGCSIAFETGSVVEAADLVHQTMPDVVLLDLLLHDGDGFRVLDLITDVRRRMRVLVLSSYCDQYTIHRVSGAGVDGFVDKGTGAIADLGAALEAMRRGKPYFCERFIAVRLAMFSDPLAFPKLLSRIEQNFVALSGSGMEDDDLAREMGITKRTVQTYRYHVLRKLGLKSAVALTAYSIEKGFSRYITPARSRSVLEPAGALRNEGLI